MTAIIKKVYSMRVEDDLLGMILMTTTIILSMVGVHVNFVIGQVWWEFILTFIIKACPPIAVILAYFTHKATIDRNIKKTFRQIGHFFTGKIRPPDNGKRHF